MIKVLICCLSDGELEYEEGQPQREQRDEVRDQEGPCLMVMKKFQKFQRERERSVCVGVKENEWRKINFVGFLGQISESPAKISPDNIICSQQ